MTNFINIIKLKNLIKKIISSWLPYSYFLLVFVHLYKKLYSIVEQGIKDHFGVFSYKTTMGGRWGWGGGDETL